MPSNYVWPWWVKAWRGPIPHLVLEGPKLVGVTGLCYPVRSTWQAWSCLVLCRQTKFNQEEYFDYVFHGFGNGLNGANDLPLNGKRKVAVGFFEVAKLGDDLVDYLNQFDLVVAGSTWNKNILLRHGLSRVEMVLQGVDTSVFNPISVPRLLSASIVIFSGGKLEIRKGQDVVIQAFKKLISVCPDALLIAAWCNDSPSVSSIAMSPYVSDAPANGEAESIGNWLEAQGIPRRNIVIPGILNSAQMASLLKQADIAVFPNRCEGGTNLVAMEAIACGIPTVLSANSGHLDLMRIGCPGIVPLPSNHPLKIPLSDYENFGFGVSLIRITCWGFFLTFWKVDYR